MEIAFDAWLMPGTKTYLASLGQFDVVYSWGVLHHTGDLWRALQLVSQRVAADGRLWIAVYNDQGWASYLWGLIKRLYNRLPPALRGVVLVPAFLRLWGPTVLRGVLAGNPLRGWKSSAERGMFPWTDVVDWVGGYPFEVATPGEVFNFCHALGFELERLKTCGGGRGCNEFLFRKNGRGAPKCAA